ncbi:MAG: hypothetical protein WCA48_30915 [Pseudomonas gingeri]
MDEYSVYITPSSRQTFLSLRLGRKEILRGALPPPTAVRHERAAQVLLAGLSQWLDSRLRVVLCADEREASFYLGLTDELGRGDASVYYAVEVPHRSPRLPASKTAAERELCRLRRSR